MVVSAPCSGGVVMVLVLDKCFLCFLVESEEVVEDVGVVCGCGEGVGAWCPALVAEVGVVGGVVGGCGGDGDGVAVVVDGEGEGCVWCGGCVGEACVLEGVYEGGDVWVWCGVGWCGEACGVGVEVVEWSWCGGAGGGV